MRARWEAGPYANLHARTFGDVGVVASRLAFRVDPAGRWPPALSTEAPLVDVWARRGGRWQVVTRYVGDWRLTRWLDRATGFGAGLLTGLALLLVARYRRRRGPAPAA